MFKFVTIDVEVFMVVDMLKKRFAPCEPIVLNDMKWLHMSSGALRQMFKRMSDKGILNRYMNGVYYFPAKDKKMLAETVINRMYITNGKEFYGFVTGLAYARQIGVVQVEDEFPVIVTNKENSRGRFRSVPGQKVYLRKPYAKITAENVKEMALLEFIKDWELYSQMSEEETFEKVTEFVEKENIDRKKLLEVVNCYPTRVAALLIKHKMV